MKYQSRTAILTLTAVSFTSLSVLSQTGPLPPRARQILKAAGETKTGNMLNGQWQVKCVVRNFKHGNLLNSSQDTGRSLVVAETDLDGSYRLYKFPSGFGEALPRLRRVNEKQFEGSDTVRGITTLVKQSVDIENEMVTITQATIDTPTNQTQTEVVCSGSRLQSTLPLRTTEPPFEGCHASPRGGDQPDRKLTLRYRSVKPFSDGLAAVSMVQRGGQSLKWGFIDRTGRIVIPIIYDVATSFHEGLAVVGKSYGRGRNLKWGVVEKLGPQVTPNMHYDAAKTLGEGFAAVGYAMSGDKGIKWNLINRENTTILHGFDEIGCFKNGRARASYTDGGVVRRGYISKVGDFYADEQ